MPLMTPVTTRMFEPLNDIVQTNPNANSIAEAYIDGLIKGKNVLEGLRLSEIKDILKTSGFRGKELQDKLNTMSNSIKETIDAIPSSLSDTIPQPISNPVLPGIFSNPNLRSFFNGPRDLQAFASGGLATGTDIVPAMLTPGEFVMSKYAVESHGADTMKAINNGSSVGDSVYNYSINVNVKSDSNPDEIARAVMTQIKSIDSQKIRGVRV
jgi:hypothetical protein